MNRYRSVFLSGLAFLFLLAALPLQAQKKIPELWGQHVHDEARALSPQTVDNLERQLKTFEDSTSNQVAILIVSSLDGEIIEQYALRVAEKWKLGKKEKDNGVLLLLAINDRKMRIEVGQGLEGPLPDAICNRIIRNEMAPNFRRGDYDAGVSAAINAILLATKGEYKAEDVPLGRKNRGPKIPFIFILLLIIILSRFLGGRGKGGSGWSSGAGWFLGGMAAGGGFGGGGGGGGGFSGGGGSFGGGGSSGSW